MWTGSYTVYYTHMMLFQKVQGFLEKHPNRRPFLPLEELRAGSEQRLDHTDTIFPGTASGGGNLPFRFRPVLAERFDKMEVVPVSYTHLVAEVRAAAVGADAGDCER